MRKIDPYERLVLGTFDRGELKSVATKAELAKFKSAARATAIKDRRINIRLSSGDLSDIQERALEEGVPYQTLIARVLHKYVDRTSRGTSRVACQVDAEPRGKAACDIYKLIDCPLAQTPGACVDNVYTNQL